MYGLYCGGSAVGIDQLAVAVNRRQPVAEFMSDAGGELSEPRQRLLQPKLLFELDDRREVRKQADDAARVRLALAEPRDGDAHMRDVVGLRHLERPSHDRMPRRQTLVDDVGERKRGRRQRADVRAFDAAGDAKHLPAGGIQNLHVTLTIDDEQTGGEAVDDLRAELLGCLGPLGHGALLRAQLLNPFLQGNGQQRRLPRVPKSMARVSCARKRT